MPSIDINEFVYPKLQFKGVKLIREDQLDMKVMSLSDFDFSEPKPVPLDETYYKDRFPGFPDNAYFALARCSEGMKSKQIRSEWKKRNKKLNIIKAQKLLEFS